MTRLVSSKMVVECDMQTCTPHSAHDATACPLQTEHLAIFSCTYSPRTFKHYTERLRALSEFDGLQ